MNGMILFMDDYRPHINIVTESGVHVYPVTYFHALAKGEVVEGLPPDVVCAILKDWLMYIGLPVPVKQGGL